MIRPLLCGLALFAASPTLAQDTATLAAAERLVEVSRVEAQLEQGFAMTAPAMSKGVMAQLAVGAATRAMYEEVTRNDYARKQKLEALFVEELTKGLREALPRFKREYAREYAKAFTKAELDAMTAFFSQGPGAKYIAQTPTINTQIAAASQRIGMEVAMVTFPKVMERAKTELDAETTK
jgi:hypothetical protein